MSRNSNSIAGSSGGGGQQNQDQKDKYAEEAQRESSIMKDLCNMMKVLGGSFPTKTNDPKKNWGSKQKGFNSAPSLTTRGHGDEPPEGSHKLDLTSMESRMKTKVDRAMSQIHLELKGVLERQESLESSEINNAASGNQSFASRSATSIGFKKIMDDFERDKGNIGHDFETARAQFLRGTFNQQQGIREKTLKLKGPKSTPRISFWGKK